METETRNRPFLNVPVEHDTAKVTTPFAYVGIPFGVPYTVEDLSSAAGAPDAVRDGSWESAWALNWGHMNFDTGHAIFPDGVPTITDCGDITVPLSAPEEIWDEGMRRIAPLVRNGVVPIVVGGLDSIPPIAVGAYEGLGKKFNILHIDAHLDFREERYGVTRGFSSGIRRIREFDCVNEVVQVGLRAMGSARMSDVQEASAAGNRLVTAQELHEMGPQAFLDSLSDELPWILTIDVDGLDPAIAPGVAVLEVGGIDFFEMGSIVQGLAARQAIAGMIFTEFQPALDVRTITARTIGRLILLAMSQAEAE